MILGTGVWISLSQPTISVVMSSEPIPVHTNLNSLIDRGVFTTVEIPSDVLTPGAVRSLDELRNRTSTARIFADEQIPEGRLTAPVLPPSPSPST